MSSFTPFPAVLTTLQLEKQTGSSSISGGHLPAAATAAAMLRHGDSAAAQLPSTSGVMSSALAGAMHPAGGNAGTMMTAGGGNVGEHFLQGGGGAYHALQSSPLSAGVMSSLGNLAGFATGNNMAAGSSMNAPAAAAAIAAAAALRQQQQHHQQQQQQQHQQQTQQHHAQHAQQENAAYYPPTQGVTPGYDSTQGQYGSNMGAGALPDSMGPGSAGGAIALAEQLAAGTSTLPSISPSTLPRGQQDLARFLMSINCIGWLQALTQEDMDLQTLMMCTEEDLQQLGLPLGPRKRIIEAVRPFVATTALG
eukprot:jgi/Chrzof1/12641/Cz07g02020.t1